MLIKISSSKVLLGMAFRHDISILVNRLAVERVHWTGAFGSCARVSLFLPFCLLS